MRIAYVTADRGIPVFGDKGASIHIQEMVRAFEALGHEVRVVCARKGSGPAADFSVEEIPAQSATSGSDRVFKERQAMAQADAIEQHLTALHGGWPFDLIYERYSLWSAAGCRAGGRLGVPVVTEVNAPLVEEQLAYRELALLDEARTLECEVFAGSTALVPVSRQLTSYLMSKGAVPERIHVIGNAVNTATFSPDCAPTRISSIPDDAFVVGFSGSLKKWHGVSTLLKAFRTFRASCPNAHLLVVGDGPKHGWMEGFLVGAELLGAATFTGWVNHNQLPGLLARMDVATAPYPESDGHYFSPLKLYEYLAVGRPVLASDIGQTAEVLDGCDGAILLPPGDHQALADAFAALHADADRLRKMREASAALGCLHDWRRNAARVVAFADAAREAA